MFNRPEDGLIIEGPGESGRLKGQVGTIQNVDFTIKIEIELMEIELQVWQSLQFNYVK